MNNSLVSCIIPVFNGEAYLAEALDSVLHQTYERIEVIVVDDGSVDGSRDVAAQYKERIRYIWQDNAGPAVAREAGRVVANGDFIAYQDADDIWHPEKLDRQIARFHANAELDICVTHVKNFWTDDISDEAARFESHRISKPVPGYVAQCMLAKSSAFSRIGGFDVKLPHAEKTEWFLRARRHGLVIELMPDVLVHRRLHPDNRSRTLATEARDEYVEILKRKIDLDRLKARDAHND